LAVAHNGYMNKRTEGWTDAWIGKNKKAKHAQEEAFGG